MYITLFIYTAKPVYNDDLMGYFTATDLGGQLITGYKSYYRGGRYRQTSLYK